RKGTLLLGLAVFGTASAVGGLVDSPAALIAVRALMGVGAALIFSATLSIISNLYTQRDERARAIGLWGALTGLGVPVRALAGGCPSTSGGAASSSPWPPSRRSASSRERCSCLPPGTRRRPHSTSVDSCCRRSPWARSCSRSSKLPIVAGRLRPRSAASPSPP